MKHRRSLAGITAGALALAVVPLGAAPAANAADFIQGIQVSPTLEGCRGDTAGYVPGTTPPVCPDNEYTTGNLGKGWNELDLVPHRLTTVLKDLTDATTTYDIIVAADNSRGSYEGYDFISPLVVNTTLLDKFGDPVSDTSCTVSSGPMLEQAGVTGGVDDAKYRIVRISQDKGTTCVFDYVQRLSITSAEYNGSSLQAYMFEKNDFSTGKRTVPIPVKEVLPQKISKTMSALQDSEHVWSVSKAATATLNLGDTCDVTTASGSATVKIEWKKLPATPSGDIAVVTTIDATNPSRRAVEIDLTDKIYGVLPDSGGAESLLDTYTLDDIIVPANTTQTIATHSITVPNGTTGLRDVASAAYTDVVFPDVPIPGTNTAAASAEVQSSGTVLNDTAIVTDVEQITGSGLDFRVTGVSGHSGSFDGYTMNTWTTGPVTWKSGELTGDGSVTFTKEVRAAKGSIEPNGLLADTASLLGSGGFTTEAKAETKISVDTKADLTISKTIDDVLQGAEQATFGFDVYNSSNVKVATKSLTFTAGETVKSVDVTDLAPDVYTVKETAAAGFTSANDEVVDLTGSICAGTASFDNDAVPAKARVVKVTSPAGFEANWDFQLRSGTENGPIVASAKTDGTGQASFSAQLGEGTYVVTETAQDGWTGQAAAACVFTVNLPGDADKEFVCTWTNTYNPSVTLAKGGDTLSKIGDDVTFTFDVTNTSSTGGAAGVPDLVCTIKDPKISYTSDAITLAAGASASRESKVTVGEWNDPFTNEATVDCVYPETTAVVATNTDTHEVNLFQPSVKVTKTGPTYTLVGRTVTYEVKIENTSSDDSPALVMDATNGFSDTKVSNVVVPDDCKTLAVGTSCTITYDYTVVAGDDPGPVLNTASVLYHPQGFPNDITASDDHSVTILHPAATVFAECTTQNAPQGGTATFKVTVTNTGDVPLALLGDSGIGLFDLAASGGVKTFAINVAVPSGSPTVTLPKVTFTAAIPTTYRLGDGTVLSRSTSGSEDCSVAALAKVAKTTYGQVDPSYDWQFAVYNGPDGFGGTQAGSTSSTLNDADGVLEFGQPALDPSKTYTVCELANLASAGWSSVWSINGVTVIPYNPNANDPVPATLGNYCFDVGAGTSYPLTAGGTLVISVDNFFPGGAPRTPGYWKNWSSCSGGGQYAKTTDDVDPKNEFVSLDEVLNDPGVSWGSFVINDCDQAVSILDQRDFKTGKKMASDAAYTLAMHLLAAELNYGAGAEKCSAADAAILAGENLLVSLKFNGTGSYLRPKNAGYQTALSLAKTLDEYNNGNLCG